MLSLFDTLLPSPYMGWLWKGFYLTIALSLGVAFLATPLGFLLAIARLSHHRFTRAPALAFISFFRNTPLLIQLFFWYFGVAGLLPRSWVLWLNSQHVLSLPAGLHLSWPSFEVLSALIGLSLYSAAFIAEEFRSGVRGVPAGQWHAAQALGFSHRATWHAIILPQAVRNCFPPLMGQYMNIIKNTSLTMAIGVAELSYASRQVETESLLAFQAFGIATLLYIFAVLVLELVGQILQRTYFSVHPKG